MKGGVSAFVYQSTAGQCGREAVRTDAQAAKHAKIASSWVNIREENRDCLDGAEFVRLAEHAEDSDDDEVWV